MDLMNDTFLYKANFMYPTECSYLQGAACITVQWQGAVLISKIWVGTREL